MRAAIRLLGVVSRAAAVAAAAMLLAVAGTLLLAAAPRPARADATTYSSAKRQFKVGILLLDSTIDPAQPAKGPENPDPFVFYIADSRADVKPQNWELVNPIAPSTVTADIAARWQARDGSAENRLTIGQKVTKNMAAYWEVSLTNTSLSQLLQFDLLFITDHRVDSFSPADREKLRKLVDGGGVLWVEDCGGMRIAPSGSLFLNLQFRNTGPAANAGPIINVPTHPILNTPYKLSFQEIANLGDKNYANYYMSAFTPQDVADEAAWRAANKNSNAWPRNTPGTQPPDTNTLVNIVGNAATVGAGGPTGFPYIAAGTYGSGAVIASSGDSGCDINDYAGGVNTGSGGNSGAVSGPNIVTAHIEDLKFVYNLIAWGSGNNAFRRNARRTANSFEDVGAPLVNDFAANAATTGALNGGAPNFLASTSAPLVVGGMLFQVGGVNAANGNFALRAYDANPQTDMDGDGNPDDGLLDLAFGAPFDEIWQSSQIAGSGNVQPSSPVYGNFTPVGTSRSRPTIFVTGPDGTLYGWDVDGLPPGSNPIFPTGAAATGVGAIVNTPPAFGSTPNTYAAAGTGGLGYPDFLTAPAPVLYDGLVYVAQPDGSIRCVDPGVDGTGRNLWVTFTAPFQDGQGNERHLTPTGSPTVGMVAQKQGKFATNSNGTTNDLMLYEPVLDVTSGGGDVLSYWLGTRNEVTKTYTANGTGTLVFTTRVATVVNPTNSQRIYTVSGGDGATGDNHQIPGLFVPTARVYSPTHDAANNIVQTAEENYALGNVSTDYAVQPAGGPYNTGLTYDGKVTVVVSNAGLGGAFRPEDLKDILVAVDYNVFYNDLGANAANAPGLTGNSGARNQGSLFRIPLASPGFVGGGGGGFSTLALSPDDLLVNSYAQPTLANSESAVPNVVGTVTATNEQDGTAQAGGSVSQQRLRFTLHPGYNTTVNSMAVADPPVIRNRLIFDPNWPLGTAGSAAPLNGRPAAISPNFESILNVVPVGAPIVGNDGIGYVLATGTSAANAGAFPGPDTAHPGQNNVTVLVAFQMNQPVTLTLPDAFDNNQPGVVAQANAQDDSVYSGGGAQAQTVSKPFGGKAGSNQWFTWDSARGRIAINNFADTSTTGQAFSATQSFVVTYTPLGSTSPKTVVIPPYSELVNAYSTTGTQTQGTLANGTQRAASSGFSPVLWFYVLPGTPTSSPTLSGGSIYFTQNRRGVVYLVAVDSDPAASDPLVRVSSGEQVLGVFSDTTNQSIQNHVRWANLALQGGATAPPVAGEGVLAVNTGNGLEVFTNTVTLVADSKRVMELDGSGAAVWAVDSPVQKTTIGGQLPVYNGTGGVDNADPANVTGRTALQRVPFSHPSVARRVLRSDYMVADTGNDRVLRMDRSGEITWILNKFNDPFGILAAGDPVTLKNPTDVQFYVTNTYADPANLGSQVIGYEAHYLIADSGNFRVLDVADYYDTRGNLRTDLNANGTVGGGTLSGEHVVVFTTRTGSAQSRSLQFQSVQRIQPILRAGQTVSPPILVAIVGNVSASGPNTTTSSDFAGGSLVALTYNPFRTPLSTWQPGAQAPAQLEPAGNGGVSIAFSDFDVVVNGATQVRRITRPTYFQEITILQSTSGQYQNIYLLCDASGVYALALNDTTQRLQAIWAFTAQDYADMFRLATLGRFPTGAFAAPPPQFLPTHVQRLASGDYLITNGWSGDNSGFASGRFVGEVFQVTPLPATTGGDTARGGSYGGFSAPNIVAAGAKFQQVMGLSSSNAAMMEQPRSAIRP